MKLDAECCIKLSYFRGLLKDKTSTISRVHRAENSFILSSNIFVVNNDATAVEVAVVAVVAVVNVVVVDAVLVFSIVFAVVVGASCTLKAIIERKKALEEEEEEREEKTF